MCDTAERCHKQIRGVKGQMSNNDSYQAMLDAVQAFHDKHDFRNKGGEEMLYRIAKGATGQNDD